MREQRSAKRPYVLAKVKIKLKGGVPSMEAVAINLTRQGIGIYIRQSRALKKGRKVTVKLIFFDGKGFKTTEDMPGTIQWVLELGGQCAAGIQFDSSIYKKHQPVLYACLEYAQRHA